MRKIQFLIYSLLIGSYLFYNNFFLYPSTTPRWIWIFLLTPIAFFLIFYKEAKLSINKSTLILFSMLLWNILSFFWSVDKCGYSDTIIKYIYLFCLFIFFYQIHFTNLINRFLQIIIILAGINFFFSIFQYFGLGDTIFYQIAAPAGTFVNKNFLSPAVSLLLPFLLYQFFAGNKKNIIFYGLSILIFLIYWIIAATRSSWFAVVIILPVTIWFLIRKKIITYNKRILGITSILLLLILLIFIDHSFHHATDYVHRTYSTQIDSFYQISESVKQRFDKWQNGLCMIKEKPILGYGAGNFDANYPLFHNCQVEDIGYSGKFFLGGIHNILLHIFIEHGLVGFFLLIYFVIRLFLLMKKKNNDRDFALFFGLIAFSLDCMWNNTFLHPTYLITILIIVTHLVQSHDTNNIKGFPITNNLKILFGIPFLLFSLFHSFYYAKSDNYFRNAIVLEAKNQTQKAWVEVEKGMKAVFQRNRNYFIASRIGFTLYQKNKNQFFFNQIKEMNDQTLKTLPYHYMPNLIDLILALDSENYCDDLKKKIDVFLAVSPNSNLVDSYEIVASIMEKDNRISEAKYYYEEILKIDPNNKVAHKKMTELKK